MRWIPGTSGYEEIPRLQLISPGEKGNEVYRYSTCSAFKLAETLDRATNFLGGVLLGPSQPVASHAGVERKTAAEIELF